MITGTERCPHLRLVGRGAGEKLSFTESLSTTPPPGGGRRGRGARYRGVRGHGLRSSESGARLGLLGGTIENIMGCN